MTGGSVDSGEIVPIIPITWKGTSAGQVARGQVDAALNGREPTFMSPPARGESDRLAASFELMAALLAETDLPQVLTLVAERAASMAGTDLAFVALPGPAPGTLTIAVATGTNADQLIGHSVRTGTSAIGSAFTSGRARSTHVAANSRIPGLTAGPILLLPLDTGEGIRGVLALAGNGRQVSFDVSTVRRLKTFVTTSATMIEIAEERRHEIARTRQMH